MRHRLGTSVGFVLMLLLASSVLLPIAASDHAYSHRYVIYGRVVDANGDPVPGLTVRLRFENVVTEGNCQPQPNTNTDAFGRTESRPTTSEYGEFIFCTHAHSLSRADPGRAFLLVAEENATTEFELDPYKRVTFVTIQLPNASEKANRGVLDRSYTVMGRLWRETSEERVEGIRVFGDTVDNTLVNITLEYNGKTTSVNTTTNGYGDFAVRIPVEERPTTGTVRIEAAGETFSGSIDPKTGATALFVEMDPVRSGLLLKVLYVGIAVLLVAAVAGGSFVAFRRMSAKREEAAIRANAQRKRANK